MAPQRYSKFVFGKTTLGCSDDGKYSRQVQVRRQQGATRRNVELICRVLGRRPALAPGGIATDIIEEPPCPASPPQRS